jgi:hypothetical protein
VEYAKGAGEKPERKERCNDERRDEKYLDDRIIFIFSWILRRA